MLLNTGLEEEKEFVLGLVRSAQANGKIIGVNKVTELYMKNRHFSCRSGLLDAIRYLGAKGIIKLEPGATDVAMSLL